MVTQTRPLTLAAEALAARLVAGQKWLTEAARTLDSQPHEWTAMRRRFADALDWWWQAEERLRTYGFSGCIHGTGRSCPLDAEVWCLSCLERSRRQERAVQGRLAA